MKNELLILILQNLILFPNQEVKLELNNDLSKEIINKSINNFGSELIIISPKDDLEVRPEISDLPSVATLAKIKSSITLPNGCVRITIRGIKRVKTDNYSFLDADKGLISVNVLDLMAIPYNLEEEKAYIKKLKKSVKKYVELAKNMTNSILGIINSLNSLNKMTDVVTALLDFKYKDKYEIFTEINYYERAKKLIALLNSEISALEFDKKLDEEIRSNLEHSEKELLIKEKINLLSRELGASRDAHAECEEYTKKINNLQIDNKIKIEFKREVRRLEATMETSPEFSIIRSYLDFVTNLPWNVSSEDKESISEIENHLNQTHYGLSDAKTRIEEYLILKKTNKNLKSPILCLIGPPGTGKTTFARELATSIGRKFIRISVGGLNDSAELTGHRRTYLGAGPGKIMNSLRKCGVNNPVLLIDEVDKLVKNYHEDPASVLLEILDQNQNQAFVDNYVGEPFDLSNIIFILTANDADLIPSALKDRLDIVPVNSYTIFDKLEIAKNYILPKLGEEYAVSSANLNISDSVLKTIIHNYTNEAGVRNLERNLATIVRKNIIKGWQEKIEITDENLSEFLGQSKNFNYKCEYTGFGIANVPAYTESGGAVLNIECSIYDGEHEIISTGTLGDMIKESILVAISYIKTNQKRLKIDAKKLAGVIHIHILDGTSKKDGPSAGVAITMAILSNLLKVPLPSDTAFTGEISLEGRILMIGGLKEKIISCYNKEIKKLYIPCDNSDDLSEIPNEIISNMEIIPVKNILEVYDAIFV